jgi:hypothetical protein
MPPMLVVIIPRMHPKLRQGRADVVHTESDFVRVQTVGGSKRAIDSGGRTTCAGVCARAGECVCACVCVCVCVCVCECVCACVCVCEGVCERVLVKKRKKGKVMYVCVSERERKERERERERVCMCEHVCMSVCVCVCVTEDTHQNQKTTLSGNEKNKYA